MVAHRAHRTARRLQAVRAFTLIELMIVVAIVGVLAALAIYGVRRYLLNSKTAEAKNSIGQMGKDAKGAYERESMPSTVLSSKGIAGVSNNLCSDATSPVPSAVGTVKGQKYQSDPAEWSVDQATAGKGFNCLRFSMTDPQYYMYSYAGTAGAAGTFQAMANGDLNGDGATSAFSIAGSVNGGIVFIAPNFAETNPEE